MSVKTNSIEAAMTSKERAKIGAPRIGVVVGTTREGRFGDKPARWILDVLSTRSDLTGELVDLRDYPLPLFDEPAAPLRSPSNNEIARRWSRKVESLDGFVFVTAEYNHGISGALKNALDYLYREFNRKPAAFVGYGGLGAARAIEQLRLVCVELQMAPTRESVHITRDTYAAVLGGGSFADFDLLAQAATATLDELAWWTHALRAARSGPSRG